MGRRLMGPRVSGQWLVGRSCNSQWVGAWCLVLGGRSVGGKTVGGQWSVIVGLLMIGGFVIRIN